MSDQDQSRTPDQYVKRAPTAGQVTSQATAYGAAGGLAISFADWVVKCHATGAWILVPPDNEFIELAAPMILLPIGVWFAQVLSIIGEIILRKLKKEDQ